MTRRMTTLIIKDKNESNGAFNYSTFTCVYCVWKLLTRMLSEIIYAHQYSQNSVPKEQKMCRKKTGERHDKIYIDKAEINKVKVERNI